MSGASGRAYLAIPGPTVVPERVLAAMHRPSPDIYDGALVAMMPGLIRDLRRLAVSDTADVAIYIANGHGAWEAAIANMFSRGDRALALATGLFGSGWAAHAQAMGVKVDVLDFGLRAPVDLARVEEALAADRDHAVRAVLVTHVDTATSIRNDIAGLRAVLDRLGHPALLVVDAVASLGCEALRFDDWGVDVMIAASQKGLMLPPGLGFVWFSRRARRLSLGSDLATPYWDWHARTGDVEFYRHFAGTAPTHHLFGLREVLTMLLDEEGLGRAWARHAALARAVWAAFDAWSAGGDIAMNVADPACRSHAVTAARLGGGAAQRLRDWVPTHAGVTLGVGIGMVRPGEAAAGDHLRIAHMGHVNAHMTLGALAAMEAGLAAIGVRRGGGALEAAAAAIGAA